MGSRRGVQNIILLVVELTGHARQQSPAHTRRAMQANRSRDTRPELALQHALREAGILFEVSARPLPDVINRVDVAIPSCRLAVFLDGCFWHGCPTHYRAPRRNEEYWAGKIALNRERDLRVEQQLTAAGWSVLRFWAHESIMTIVGEIQSFTPRLGGGRHGQHVED